MNLLRAGRARLALGPTRDVVIIEGDVVELPRGTDPQLQAAFAAAAGFEPPEGYVYLRITPRDIQAWREADELAGRRLMRDGAWL